MTHATKYLVPLIDIFVVRLLRNGCSDPTGITVRLQTGIAVQIIDRNTQAGIRIANPRSSACLLSDLVMLRTKRLLLAIANRKLNDSLLVSTV